ncbi:MAG: aryl-sulfate sulfotransferase [Phycisphaerae bacterium]|nr:aryl-sulfate sulfotransferase [Phycisphaerae bacterium]
MSLTRAIRTAVFASSVLLCGFIPYAAGQSEHAGPVSQGSSSPAQPGQQRMPPGDRPEPPWGRPRQDANPTKRGLILNTDAASVGYTLFAPLNSTTTYLVDMKGEVAHSWPSEYVPGQAVYLLDDGSLLRCGREHGNRHFGGGGIGGRVQRIAPDGKVLWEFVYADEKHCLHHDIEPLLNGHVLMIAWEKKTREDAIAAGRDPEEMTGDEMWPDCIIEVEPQGASGGKTIWEWHVWDHVVQDFDKDKPNHGVVADHPELIDLNYRRWAPRETPAEVRRLRALGYIGGRESDDDENDGEGEDDNGPPWHGSGGPGGPDMRADWCHTNSVAYNAKLDQIAISVHSFNEIWIIDHSTTMKEATGHAGGRYGRGGDLLYRWGNPRAYGAGDAKDQQLFAQHDVRWIPEGMPGAGHLMVFNNGGGRPDGRYSSVVEIVPPIDSTGRYTLRPGQAFGPAKPCWEYAAPNKQDFFSHSVSGAERLANGNTLICSGEQGRIFEVTTDGKIVWEYVNPYVESRGPGRDGGPPGGGWRPRRFRDGPPDGEGSQDALRPEGRGDGRRRPPPDDAVHDGADGGARRVEGPTSRPWGRRRQFPPAGRPGGRWGPPGSGPRGPRGSPGGPGGPGGPPGGGVFRATRLAPDNPGVQQVLGANHTGSGLPSDARPLAAHVTGCSTLPSPQSSGVLVISTGFT